LPTAAGFPAKPISQLQPRAARLDRAVAGRFGMPIAPWRTLRNAARGRSAVIDQGPTLVNKTLNALTAHIAVLDSNGVILSVNEAWRRFARTNGGVPGAESYIGTNYLAVCQDALRRGDATARPALSGIEEVLRGDRGEFALEYPCSAPDRERWFRMSVTRFATGAERYLVVAHDEITTQKQHEHALEASERLLRAVLDALPIGVWILGPDGRIVQGNPAGLRIWAGARFVGPPDFGQYKGWWLSTGQPIAADEWAAARAIRNGETSIDEEVEIECFDKTRKIIQNSAVPLYDRERRITGAIIVNQDITARKRAETEREAMLREHDRLRSAAEEANRLKDDFIATLSHELRTPLNSVLGWAAILKRALPDRQAAERAAAAIERNAKLQAQLLNDTLEVSRIVRGKLTLDESDVDLAAVVGEVVETMSPAAIDKGVTLVEDVSGGHATVHGDPIRLQQVVWNLLVNALKFTPAGGRIEVRTNATEEGVEVSVRDTGVGIAPEVMSFLFDRFRQGEASLARTHVGLGLGLAIVKELVELHHGTITVESPGEGQGATFTVRLPIVARGRDGLSDNDSLP
jgi:signal transduction histidine kinase